MERNFTGGDAMKEFKPDHQDWHLLGDAMLDRKAESGGEDFLEWWREYKRLVCKRWPNRATTIDALYGYLDEWYFGSGWDKRSPIASCQARQPRS